MHKEQNVTFSQMDFLTVLEAGKSKFIVPAFGGWWEPFCYIFTLVKWWEGRGEEIL
jgi:hypothetical protein